MKLENKLRNKVLEYYNELELYKYDIASVEDLTEDLINETKYTIKGATKENIIVFLIGIATHNHKLFKKDILKTSLKRIAKEMKINCI